MKRSNKTYYVDIPNTFARNSITNDLSTVSNERAVNQSLYNIIRTTKGSRPFDPEFGCDIDQSMFENMSDISSYQIQRSIREAI